MCKVYCSLSAWLLPLFLCLLPRPVHILTTHFLGKIISGQAIIINGYTWRFWRCLGLVHNNVNERVYFLFLELILLDQCIFQATNKLKKFEQKCRKVFFVLFCKRQLTILLMPCFVITPFRPGYIMADPSKTSVSHPQHELP